LILGVSTKNLFSESGLAQSSIAGIRAGLNAHAAYNFKLGENFQLTPRVLFTTYDGFNRLGFNATTTFKNKYSIGATISSRDSFGFNLGWDIVEKIRVAYSFNKTVSKLSNGVSGGSHGFYIGYLLKNSKTKKFVNVGTPAF